MSGPNLPEYRHARSSSLSIPPPTSAPLGQSIGPASPSSRFEGPRSPPNTAHVPCKFFRQGTCQAGNACPFSHDLSNAAENVCKYFAKGNCKFGPKCANIHILPDGRRINYGKNGVTIGPAPMALSPSRPVAPAPNNFNASTSALTNGLYRAADNVPPYSPAYPPFQGSNDERQHQMARQPSLDSGLPTIDTPGYSHGDSVYGSPRDDEFSRYGLALSPANPKGLSVLDAPLPASFDSNGISNAARFPAAPWPSSVPNKFGFESPSPSLNAVKDARTSEALKLLHTSAFGSSDHLAPNVAPSSSPSGLLTEEHFGKRMMHSSRYMKPRMLSSSLPKGGTVDRDWEAEFAFLEEDYVPQNLQDLLTPAEKARRGSLRAVDAELPENLTKFGSPAAAASPSRWGPLFQRQREEEIESRPAKHAQSAFGHVGSPLRNSSLAEEVGRQNGSRSFGAVYESESMSVLTQQIQRTRLDEGSGSPMLHPSSAVGRAAGVAAPGRDRERAADRHVSTGSTGSALGRITTPIDEEDPSFVFSMEEEDDTQVRPRKSQPSSSGMEVGGGWSYAGVGAGKAKDQDSSAVAGRG